MLSRHNYIIVYNNENDKLVHIDSQTAILECIDLPFDVISAADVQQIYWTRDKDQCIILTTNGRIYYCDDNIKRCQAVDFPEAIAKILDTFNIYAVISETGALYFIDYNLKQICIRVKNEIIIDYNPGFNLLLTESGSLYQYDITTSTSRIKLFVDSSIKISKLVQWIKMDRIMLVLDVNNHLYIIKPDGELKKVVFDSNCHERNEIKLIIPINQYTSYFDCNGPYYLFIIVDYDNNIFKCKYYVCENRC